MATARKFTRRADLEESDKTISLREILNELPKESERPLTDIRNPGKSTTHSSTSGQPRRCLALTSHPPSIDFQYPYGSTPHKADFILTSPLRKPLNVMYPVGTYSILPFSKQALLVEVLGLVNPDVHQISRPKAHLCITLRSIYFTLPIPLPKKKRNQSTQGVLWRLLIMTIAGTPNLSSLAFPRKTLRH